MCILSTLGVCPNSNNLVQVAALIFLAALLWKYWRSYPTVLVSTKASSISVMTVYIICISDETCVLPHDDRGLLTTADTGSKASGSQFCITFKPNSHLDRFVSINSVE